ncbi:MAG: YajQ family cyclic di-GMP-binding protein [Actinobacteria bacterium]|nr:YajQ family cyclic di-GMP-binding protein [Actinomycetota bacterium]MCL6105171.1 YajQ family cyclic di-GMP-binding protein [Actinomycetota bacterium]
MPSFDIVSEIDYQEVRNAVDQTNREAATRFDFKGTTSTVEVAEKNNRILLNSSTPERLKALMVVLQEKLVRRKISLKALSIGNIEDAARGTVRQQITLKVGIGSEEAKTLNRFIKNLGIKSVNTQTQGQQLRVTSKKRDDLQAVISALKEQDFGIPLEFVNFRD